VAIRTMGWGGDCGLEFSELNIKPIRRTKMQNEPHIFAFVSEKEKEKQISEIEDYYKRKHGISSSDIIFLNSAKSIWDKLKELEEQKHKGTKGEDTKGKDIMVVTDLRVFSEDTNELAETLCVITYDHRIRVEVIKEEHSESLKGHQPENYPKELLLIEGFRKRVLAGLEEVCRKILKDDDK